MLILGVPNEGCLLGRLRNRVLEHIEDVAGAVAGRLVDWDVINENYWNHDLMDILGNHVMVDWFEKAHEVDPHAKLYLNDNNIISAGALDETHREFYIETAQYLLDQGAPLHGLGTQCHFGSNPTPPERIWAVLDELDDLGLEIQATEFDIDSDDPEYQVNYTRDFMTAYFAHPSTVGILMWGFWEGKHWRPKAALWDRDWNLRPHGRTWIDLVTETWWTDETLATDTAGQASLRGFLGAYTIAVRLDERTLTAEFHHRPGGTTVEVVGSQVHVQESHASAQLLPSRR
jgi:GH35 family endo-1,4-beta-xylanase